MHVRTVARLLAALAVAFTTGASAQNLVGKWRLRIRNTPLVRLRLRAGGNTTKASTRCAWTPFPERVLQVGAYTRPARAYVRRHRQPDRRLRGVAVGQPSASPRTPTTFSKRSHERLLQQPVRATRVDPGFLGEGAATEIARHRHHDLALAGTGKPQQVLELGRQHLGRLSLINANTARPPQRLRHRRRVPRHDQHRDADTRARDLRADAARPGRRRCRRTPPQGRRALRCSASATSPALAGLFLALSASRTSSAGRWPTSPARGSATPPGRGRGRPRRPAAST